MPAFLHAYPQDRVSNIPENERILKVQAKKRLEFACMNPFCFFSCIRGISIFLFAFQADSRGGETERPAAA
jgi:hypothetical protein